MRTLLESELDLDEAGLAGERGLGEAAAIIGDKDIRLLRGENRIAVAKGPTTRIPAEGDTVGYDVPLTCVVHPDPRCRFQWSRLLVDLSPTPTAKIADMSPREVTETQPVEVTTSIGLGLSFNIVANVLAAEVAPQYQRKRTVYYPSIIASGTGFTRGYWDFLALGDDYLHADRDLRLLVAAPTEAPLYARFHLRAKVRMGGVPGLIPLIARTGAIEETHRLD